MGSLSKSSVDLTTEKTIHLKSKFLPISRISQTEYAWRLIAYVFLFIAYILKKILSVICGQNYEWSVKAVWDDATHLYFSISWWVEYIFQWLKWHQGDVNCNYRLFTKLPLPGDSKRYFSVFESSCHLPSCLPHTVETSHCPFNCWTSSREGLNTIFYSFWYDLTSNPSLPFQQLTFYPLDH